MYAVDRWSARSALDASDNDIILAVNVRGGREESVEHRYTVQREQHVGYRDHSKNGDASKDDVGWVPWGAPQC